MQAIAGLIQNANLEGEVWFQGANLLTLSQSAMKATRRPDRHDLSKSASSLHPYYTTGSQIAEILYVHQRVGKQEARARVVDILGQVGIPSPEERYGDYPHQFSGCMRQREMIAMALVLKPDLVIADEPTTALDVTVQAQIIALLDDLRQQFGTTIMLITNDLGLLSSVADDVMFMYAGHRMEYWPGPRVFRSPSHPYTAGLLRSSPATYVPGSKLAPIRGRPLCLLAKGAGCVFATRCDASLVRCAG